MALNCFQNSAEPIKVYKVLVGAFVGNAGNAVGKCQCLKLLCRNEVLIIGNYGLPTVQNKRFIEKDPLGHARQRAR